MITALKLDDRVQATLDRSLHELVSYTLSLPSKGLRSRLVHLGCRLSGGDPGEVAEHRRRCEIGASVVERIHAGSLIVDDIEDESVVRRDFPTLHLKYGLAKALNAGNWLYFAPLTHLPELQISPQAELQLHRDCLRVLANAHCGQAIDLGARIDEVPASEVPSICAASLELKTGELTGLALRIGGYAAGAPAPVRDKLHELGRLLGMGLQMLDDVNNICVDPQSLMGPKRMEDLRLKRPSWIWSYAATELSPADYARWIHAVRALPDERELRLLCEELDLPGGARAAAIAHLKSTAAKFAREFESSAWAEIGMFVQKMEKSYG